MSSFFEFISDKYRDIKKFFTLKKNATKRRILKTGVICFIIGILVTVLLTNTNARKNRLSFSVNPSIQRPGYLYEQVSSPLVPLNKLGNEKKLNVKYDFTYKYSDANKRNSKAEICISCPSEFYSKILGTNRVSLCKKTKIGENTEIVFETIPTAIENSGYIELELQFEDAPSEFDINIDGDAYDKILFWHGGKYAAGTASQHFRIIKTDEE